MEIIPAILPTSWAELEEKVALVGDLVGTVQIDICDGHFVDTKTWPYVGDGGEFRELLNEDRGLPRWEDLNFECDLMVRHPEGVMHDWVKAGASRIILHVESIKAESLRDTIEEWKHVVEIGLAFTPSTPLETLAPHIPHVAFVQCMGSDAIGRSGVPLDPRVLTILQALRAEYPHLSLGVDIGVNEETIGELLASGATRFAIGSAIFKAVDVHGALRHFQSLL